MCVSTSQASSHSAIKLQLANMKVEIHEGTHHRKHIVHRSEGQLTYASLLMLVAPSTICTHAEAHRPEGGRESLDSNDHTLWDEGSNALSEMGVSVEGLQDVQSVHCCRLRPDLSGRPAGE